MTKPSQRPEREPPPRNRCFGEFWFGRLLSLITVIFVFAGTAAGLMAGVRGTDAVKLLGEGFWVLLALALVYNSRAAIHDRLTELIRLRSGRG